LQADFPSTPSSVYSKRIFETDHAEQDALKVDAALPNLNNSTSSAGSANENATASLDQTTKSLEKLYVSPVPVSLFHLSVKFCSVVTVLK